jgi:hypothetical protein
MAKKTFPEHEGLDRALALRILAACAGARVGPVVRIAATDVKTMFSIHFADAIIDETSSARLENHKLRVVSGAPTCVTVEIPVMWLGSGLDSAAPVLPLEPLVAPAADEFERLRQQRLAALEAERSERQQSADRVKDELIHDFIAAQARPKRITIRTLVQDLSVPERLQRADRELGAALNDGWEIMHWSDFDTRRIVTLKRADADETEKAAVAEAEAVVSAAFEAPEPVEAHIVDARPLGEFTRAILAGGLDGALKLSNERVRAGMQAWLDERRAAAIERIPERLPCALTDASVSGTVIVVQHD